MMKSMLLSHLTYINMITYLMMFTMSLLFMKKCDISKFTKESLIMFLTNSSFLMYLHLIFNNHIYLLMILFIIKYTITLKCSKINHKPFKLEFWVEVLIAIIILLFGTMSISITYSLVQFDIMVIVMTGM